MQEVVESQVREVEIVAAKGVSVFCCHEYGVPRTKEENGDNGVRHCMNDVPLDPRYSKTIGHLYTLTSYSTFHCSNYAGGVTTI